MKTICVLSIAGSDSSGGAGIQADLKTFTVLGLFGTCVITAITAQNTKSIIGIKQTDSHLLDKQLKVILEDLPIKAIKIGMLFSKELIEIVIKHIKPLKKIHLVVDPVMISSSGFSLLQENSTEILINNLCPLANIITPNIPEMEKLTQIKINTEKKMIESCEILYEKIKVPILLKGGHRENNATDILYEKNKIKYFTSKKIKTKNTHGSGCTLSSAITSYLAKGYSLSKSIKLAKTFITKAIKYSIDIGKGNGPVNHLWQNR